MQKKYDVYAIGNALVDTEAEVSDAFLEQMGVDKGLMTLVEIERQQQLLDALSSTPVKRAAGGSACNTIVGVCRFGGTAFYSCKVANDEDGAFYVADLHECGADTNMQPPYPAGITGKCLVLVTPDAERSMNTNLAISADISIDETDDAALAQSRYLYLEGFLASSESGRAAARHLHQQAKKQGVKTALTFSDAAMVEFCRDGLNEMLGDGVDVLFCNEAEATAYTQTDQVDAALDALKPLAGTVIITLGDKGALVWDGQQTHRIDTPRIEAVDSNGAGDMFAGAYLFAVTHGKTPVEAANLAAKSAAQVVTQFGPRLTTKQHQALLA